MHGRRRHRPWQGREEQHGSYQPCPGASNTWESSLAWEGNLQGSSGCVILQPLQDLSPWQGLPKKGGHLLTTLTHPPA